MFFICDFGFVKTIEFRLALIASYGALGVI